MKRLLAMAVVIAAFGLGGSSASAAPPNLTAAQVLCEQEGGALFPFDGSYSCLPFPFFPRPEPLSERQRRAAQAVCEGAYGGTWIPTVPAPLGAGDGYGCTFGTQ